MVFTRFSGLTHSESHKLTHSQKDRPEHSVPPAPLFNSGGRMTAHLSWSPIFIQSIITLQVVLTDRQTEMGNLSSFPQTH